MDVLLLFGSDEAAGLAASQRPHVALVRVRVDFGGRKSSS